MNMIPANESADAKVFTMLENLSDLIPMYNSYFNDWNIKVFNRTQYPCQNYLSANRRNFYKIHLITQGEGLLTIGLNHYHIHQPTILFLHPNDILSWRSLAAPGEEKGHFLLIRKNFIGHLPMLKLTIDTLGLFSNKARSVITLGNEVIPRFERLWVNIHQEVESNKDFVLESVQAHLQLLLVDSMREGKFSSPEPVRGEYSHVHRFFRLLEEQIAEAGLDNPLKMRTAKEYAVSLDLHPNYLNKILKEQTGENVSTHIRNRLIEQVKILLSQSSLGMQDISYIVGFSDYSNFHYFFKNNTGITPTEFRKVNQDKFDTLSG
ncbi:AraC family transcriptional regulator [Limibacter armeniacum]|uniref:helix-turn-helix domain-containing protein n=1 Tax=Limibacter armeniacum TaxID=466084 RepID=UPI002FE64FBE